ncbi:MAG: biopolymer transport protein ExbB [Paraglaciecola sp.]|jgi:biopolymer transport protein ExbB
MSVLQQLTESVLIWIILLLALTCYSILIHLFLSDKQAISWSSKTLSWLQTLPTLLGALPLLGLLGTIIGLLTCFTQMAKGSMDIQQLLSSGIAEALLTTELGLLMVVPGWLMLALLQRKLRLVEGSGADGADLSTRGTN